MFWVVNIWLYFRNKWRLTLSFPKLPTARNVIVVKTSQKCESLPKAFISFKIMRQPMLDSCKVSQCGFRVHQIYLEHLSCVFVPRTLSLSLNQTKWVECVWNVMAHAQKPDFVFRRNGRVHLNRRGRQFIRLLAAELHASAAIMLDTPRSEVVWRVLATHFFSQFPLHFPSRASPWTITFELDSTLMLGYSNYLCLQHVTAKLGHCQRDQFKTSCNMPEVHK